VGVISGHWAVGGESDLEYGTVLVTIFVPPPRDFAPKVVGFKYS